MASEHDRTGPGSGTSQAALLRDTRVRLARSLREAIDDASPPNRENRDRDAVGLSTRRRYGLLGIADWLEHADEVNILALRRAETLVAEVSTRSSSREGDALLGELIWWVADGMQVCPPHEWGCPVITKLDPDHTTWTCRRCGHVAVGHEPDQRPD